MRYNVRTSDGKYVATVAAVQVGVRFVPDPVAVRRAIDHRWRKAFDRARWRMLRQSVGPRRYAGSMTLVGRRWRPIATLVCSEAP